MFYGGRLGLIISRVSPVCPECYTRQVQIMNYLYGDPSYRCRKCKHEFIIKLEGLDDE